MKIYFNKTTGKTYDLSITADKIELTEGEFENGGNKFKSKPHGSCGLLKYSVFGNFMVLEHIESFPEEGSGLGSLMVLLLAEKAKRESLAIMLVTKPATDKQGFYAQMGFDIEGAKEQVREKYRKADREVPDPITVTEARASTDVIHNNAYQSVVKRWEFLEPRPAPLARGERIDRTLGQPSTLANAIGNADL